MTSNRRLLRPRGSEARRDKASHSALGTGDPSRASSGLRARRVIVEPVLAPNRAGAVYVLRMAERRRFLGIFSRWRELPPVTSWNRALLEFTARVYLRTGAVPSREVIS